MKIDEAAINHNAVRLIKEAIADPYGYCEQEDGEPKKDLLMTLGAIYGICNLADALKALLKE